MYSLYSSCQSRFFSTLRLSFKAEDLLLNSLKKTHQDKNRYLKTSIILNGLKQAKQHQSFLGQLSLADAKLPGAWSLQQKLDFLTRKRSHYYARPVLTAHPTEVLSEEIQIKINAWIQKALAFDDNQVKGRISVHELKGLETELEEVLQQHFLPPSPMTPEQEMARQDRLYLDMMESWPQFNRKNIHAFAKHHGYDIAEVAPQLTKANKYSYQNVASWSIADIDGNQRRTRQTMENMESSLQIAIIDRYLAKLSDFQAHSKKINSVVLYLQRCRQSIEDGIYFNLDGSVIAKQRLIKILKLVQAEETLPLHLAQRLEEMIEFVDLVGFRGDLKQFVRQSSHKNADVMQNFVEILESYDSEIKRFNSEFQHYKSWTVEAKARLNALLRSDSGYFKYLKTHKHLLSNSSLRELDILDFVREYQDNFSYILSDTKDYHSLDAVVILFGFAAYCSNKLYIDDIRRPPVHLIPLCETPEDLANLATILDAMLNNPYLKQVIIAKSELIYVAGPSDLGKEGGIFAHFNLIEAEKIARQVLQQHQARDPSLNKVELRVLYGLGGDFHRRVSDARSQLFCTFQGAEACQLAGVHAYQAYVEAVIGQPSENTYRALQLQAIEAASPENYEDLKKLVAASIKGYRAFIFSPEAMNLFRTLSMPYQLGALLNTSSRAESKTSVQPDICKSRAIGIANYEISSLFFMRIFMALDGLIPLPATLKAKFPLFYQESLVIQELVEKIFFAFAISREDLAIKKVFGDEREIDLRLRATEPFIKSEEYALAYILERKLELFKVLLAFMPEEQQLLGQKFLTTHTNEDMSFIALGLLKLLGSKNSRLAHLHQEITEVLLPRYKILASCLQDYANAKHRDEADLSLCAENVVLALRGDKWMTAGPQTIAKKSLKSLTEPCLAELSSILKK